MVYPIKVYAIRHNITKRMYIGVSKNPKKRIKSHLSALRGGRHNVELMQKDFYKYGEDYTFYNLCEIPSCKFRFLENMWQVIFKTRENGYNSKDNYSDFDIDSFEKIEIYTQKEVQRMEKIVKMIKKKMVDSGRDDFVNYLSEILGISKQWASSKLNCKTSFTTEEISKLNSELDFDAIELKCVLSNDE